MIDVLLWCCLMYWFIDVGVKNSIDIMVEAPTDYTIEFICVGSCHSCGKDIFYNRDDCLGNCKF